MPSDHVLSLEILLVADDEAVAQTLSERLRRAGHRVTAATTIAGAVETLMRRGPDIDVIMTSTRLDSSLGDDTIQYSHKFAVNARLVVLGEVTSRVEHVDQLELTPTRSSTPERHRTMSEWD